MLNLNNIKTKAYNKVLYNMSLGHSLYETIFNLELNQILNVKLIVAFGGVEMMSMLDSIAHLVMK